MTVLRRHLFAILAVCAALAVGIALGAGPLQGDSGAADEAALQSDNTGLSDRVAQLEQTRVFDDAMTKAASSGLVSGRLSGRTLTLVVLPGVPGATVDGVRTAVQQAGGSTAVTAVVQPDMVDPAKKTYVDSVAANSMKGLKDLGPGAKGETYDQVAALVARAYVGHAGSLTFDDAAVKIDSELQGAKLIRLEGDPGQRGSLVVVLAPGDHGEGSVPSANNVIRTALVEGLANAADGTLVATPPTGSNVGGLVAALAGSGATAKLRVSTLNAVDGAGGVVAAVFALDAAADGKPGAYGVVDGEPVLPPGLVLPSQ